MRLPLIIASQLLLGVQGNAQTLPGFNVTVTCQAHSLTGGHPRNATRFTMGVWQNGEKNAYVFERDHLRVGLQATKIFPGLNGQLISQLLAKDLDNNQMKNYGSVDIQFDGTGNGKGFLHSNFESSEPYVLGTLELNNCRTRRL